jgi:hypothetical protein
MTRFDRDCWSRIRAEQQTTRGTCCAVIRVVRMMYRCARLLDVCARIRSKPCFAERSEKQTCLRNDKQANRHQAMCHRFAFGLANGRHPEEV